MNSRFNEKLCGAYIPNKNNYLSPQASVSIFTSRREAESKESVSKDLFAKQFSELIHFEARLLGILQGAGIAKNLKETIVATSLLFGTTCFLFEPHAENIRRQITQIQSINPHANAKQLKRMAIHLSMDSLRRVEDLRQQYLSCLQALKVLRSEVDCKIANGVLTEAALFKSILLKAAVLQTQQLGESTDSAKRLMMLRVQQKAHQIPFDFETDSFNTILSIMTIQIGESLAAISRAVVEKSPIAWFPKMDRARVIASSFSVEEQGQIPIIQYWPEFNDLDGLFAEEARCKAIAKWLALEQSCLAISIREEDEFGEESGLSP